MSKTLIYAGIGSRETPEHVLEQMCSIAQQLGDTWLLRSGHAAGADMAFEQGCISVQGKKQILVPWYGFNGAPLNNPDYIRPSVTKELAQFTAGFHPAWSSCTDAAKLLHMRNSCQILGLEGTEPATMVICWTKDGKRSGGTGQALRIAEKFLIPIFDLAITGVDRKLCDFVAQCEESAAA